MQSEVNQEENLNTTDFDEHFAKISSYIVDTLHGVPLEMTEDEKEQFRIQVISNQYAERLLSEAEKTETYRGLSKIDILHTVSIPQLARTIPLKGLNLSLEKYRMPDGVIIEVESSSHYLGSFSEKNDSSTNWIERSWRVSVFTRWILKKHKQPAICREFWKKIEESILPATAPRTFVNSHNRDQEPIPALRLHRFGDIFSPSCYNIVDFFYLCFAIINI